jgi:hypothetical protein
MSDWHFLEAYDSYKEAQTARKRMKIIVVDDSNGSISIESCESCFEINGLDFEQTASLPSLPKISSSLLNTHKTNKIDFIRSSKKKTFLIIEKDLSRMQWVIKTNSISIKNILNQRKDKQNFSNCFEVDNNAMINTTKKKLDEDNYELQNNLATIKINIIGNKSSKFCMKTYRTFSNVICNSKERKLFKHKKPKNDFVNGNILNVTSLHQLSKNGCKNEKVENKKIEKVKKIRLHVTSPKRLLTPKIILGRIYRDN